MFDRLYEVCPLTCSPPCPFSQSWYLLPVSVHSAHSILPVQASKAAPVLPHATLKSFVYPTGLRALYALRHCPSFLPFRVPVLFGVLDSRSDQRPLLSTDTFGLSKSLSQGLRSDLSVFVPAVCQLHKLRASDPAVRTGQVLAWFPCKDNYLRHELSPDGRHLG